MAFTVVVGVDWVVAVFAFQETTTRFLESYMTVAGLIGLCAQMAFACFPISQARERETGIAVCKDISAGTPTSDLRQPRSAAPSALARRGHGLACIGSGSLLGH